MKSLSNIGCPTLATVSPWLRWVYASLALFLLASTPAHSQAVITVPNPPNTPATLSKHYVVLVSLDGFRFDYPTKYGALHLQAMANRGASAPDGMLPSYPSLTFPNHLSLITGLYPEHHGIVANTFFDPARGATYSYTNPKTATDGSWYSGTPLWVLAEQQGMRAACLFWPGSEAEIQGKRPSYYLKFDDKLDDIKRIDQIAAWLALPPDLRPHFITLYYSNVDHAGHTYAPDSDEVRAAVHHLDDMIGLLQEKLAATKLPVDLVVVSDHGMVALKPDPITLSDFADLSGFHTEGSLLYAEDDDGEMASQAYSEFKAHPDPRFSVYRRAEVPAALHFDGNPREGDPVIVPNGPYTIRAHAPTAGAESRSAPRGGHGFDPHTMPEMKAIFFAEGPDVRPHVVLPKFENVGVYPYIAQMLGLTQPAIDGEVYELQSAIPEQEDKPRDAGGSVLPPRVAHSARLKFPQEAKKAKTGGKVLVGLWVGRDGLPSHLHVIRRAGFGLDEAAVEAVGRYVFKPATENGSPVAVRLNVEVEFKVF